MTGFYWQWYAKGLKTKVALVRLTMLPNQHHSAGNRHVGQCVAVPKGKSDSYRG